ncbi:MAG TPA: hypothetical protein VLX09_13650 [Stellaceae bacterium]|nr:hypothetical protein [Stellaceae bacterium]
MADTKGKNPRKGIPLDKETADKLDPKRIPTSQKPAKQEVAGQDALYGDWTQCPYCGHVGWTSGLHTDYYIPVRCGACGRIFMA